MQAHPQHRPETDFRPAVSVVVENRESGPQAIRSLDSLACQTLPYNFEVIVADCSGNSSESRAIAARYPAFRFLRFPEPTSTPMLLKAGLSEARGDIVAVTNTHCVFPPDWLEKLLLSHDAASGFAVIGGAVAYGGRDKLGEWAAYLADYGPFLPGTPRAETSILAGCHVSYKRAVIDAALPSMAEGYWKVFFHQRLKQQGLHFLFDPDLVCSCTLPETTAGFAIRYFRTGAQFAAWRATQMSVPARIARIGTCPVLPLVLLIRRVRPLWKNNCERLRVAAAVPFLLMFILFWTAGEFTGYCRMQRSGQE